MNHIRAIYFGVGFGTGLWAAGAQPFLSALFMAFVTATFTYGFLTAYDALEKRMRTRRTGAQAD